MRKLCCMVALAAITFGSVYAGTPVKTSVADTVKKVKIKGTKTGVSKTKVKLKKDTTKTKM